MTGIEFVTKCQDVLKIRKIEKECNLGQTTLYKALSVNSFSKTVEISLNQWYKRKYGS